jgi:HSP20 family molecular chaperone IbpA
MDSDQRSQRDEGFVRRYEYDDGALIAADLGPETTDVSVEVLEDAVIVVTGDDDQYEFDVADGDAEAFMKNGVLTIYVTEA